MFKSTRSGIGRSLEGSFEFIYRWLQCPFNVNPDTHFLIVQTNPVSLWKLKHICNTLDWKMYMKETLRGDWYHAN
jgi:hypothetical protein